MKKQTSQYFGTILLAVSMPVGTHGVDLATTMFFTDEATFLAATTSTTLLDFEGVVADASSFSGNPLVNGGVSFVQSGGEGLWSSVAEMHAPGVRMILR